MLCCSQDKKGNVNKMENSSKVDVIIAEHAGFCMGVDLALKKLDHAIENGKKAKQGAVIKNKVVTLGPIIHNPQVLKEYEEKQVKLIDSVDEIDSDMTVVIRAHGITQDEEKKIRELARKTIDATCPKVKAAQLSVERATKKALLKTRSENKNNADDVVNNTGKRNADERVIHNNDSLLLLYGEEEHPEVRGILSYSAIPYLVFSDPDAVYDEVCSLFGGSFPKYLVLASQTTQNKELYTNFVKVLESRFCGELEVLDTICNATYERQDAVRRLAEQTNSTDSDSAIDILIVVGGKTSGNTRRLAEIAKICGLECFHIETAQELENIIKSEKVQETKVNNKSLKYGITAGASTPKKYIDEVYHKLIELVNR